MTVRLPNKDCNIKPAEGEPWFLDSWEFMRENIVANPYEWNDPERLYERFFNVKLITKRDEGHGFPIVLQLEFPSEAEAAMFLLRWS